MHRACIRVRWIYGGFLSVVLSLRISEIESAVISVLSFVFSQSSVVVILSLLRLMDDADVEQRAAWPTDPDLISIYHDIF